MQLIEKAAYIKGLAEGLGVDESTKEGKILKQVSELLGEMAEALQQLDEDVEQVCDDVDDIGEELENLEADLYGDDEDDGEGFHDDTDGSNDPYYEVACPSCGETVYVSEGDLEAGEAICPACKTEFEVSLVDEDDEAEDDGPAGYEITCPACGAVSKVDEDELLEGEPVCPACGKALELDVTVEPDAPSGKDGEGENE